MFITNREISEETALKNNTPRKLKVMMKPEKHVIHNMNKRL